MLIAAAMDGNQQVLPLAYAIVDDESSSSWKWFLQQLSRHVIRGRRGVCLISDRHPGIIKAVREGSDFMSLHGAHRYCLRHFLDQINKEKWTASHDGGWRTGILTTNMSECINGVLKGARRLPLTAIVEITLKRTANHFLTREAKSHAILRNIQLWTNFAYKMFNQWHQKSIEHTVTKYNYRQQSASVVTRRHSGYELHTHVVKIPIENVHAESAKSLFQLGIVDLVNIQTNKLTPTLTPSKVSTGSNGPPQDHPMRESIDFHTNATLAFVGTRLRENPGRNPRRVPENTPWARTMLQPLYPYGTILNLDVIDFRNIEKLIDEWVAAMKKATTTLELDKENFIRLLELSLEGWVKIGCDNTPEDTKASIFIGDSKSAITE
ncbi:UNVERIFIED_CONTAM: hypothetical protein Slati_3950900 [Sesamum latifolium]|uniref:MULE transposase domain-containing protein n=1 Tax=Sesamum latifolium TaxID=2727402 RepID=A0AAW2TND7_9LAMI